MTQIRYKHSTNSCQTKALPKLEFAFIIANNYRYHFIVYYLYCLLSLLIASSINTFDAQDEFAPLAIHAHRQGKLAVPQNSHTGLAKRTGVQMLRRSYSYASGVDVATGQLEAGLLFISFQKTPKQFIDIQHALGNHDKMTEYTTPNANDRCASVVAWRPTATLYSPPA